MPWGGSMSPGSAFPGGAWERGSTRFFRNGGTSKRVLFAGSNNDVQEFFTFLYLLFHDNAVLPLARVPRLGCGYEVASSFGPFKLCGWRDSNSQGLRHTPLKRARIPIPPHPLVVPCYALDSRMSCLSRV